MKSIRLLLFIFAASLSAQTTVLVNNSAWAAGRSPYNWYTSGSTYIEAVNPGAYFKVNFSGTSVSLNVDVSAISGASVAAKKYPQIAWSIDGGAQQTYQLLSTDTSKSLGSSLSNATHSLRLTFLSSDAYSPRWTGEMSLKITGIVLDTGKALSTATLKPKNLLAYGDSITEGAWVLGIPTDLTNYSLYESGNGSYLDILAAGLGNVEWGKAAFGGQSWMNTFNSDIPPLPSAWTYYYSTLSRSPLSPSPDIVVINIGTNDTSISAGTISTWLTSLRAAAPSAYIFLLVPFNQNLADTISTQFAAYQATPDAKAFIVNLGSPGVAYSTTVPLYSYDGLHPNAAGQAELATLVLAQMIAAMNTGGAAVSGGVIIDGVNQ